MPPWHVDAKQHNAINSLKLVSKVFGTQTFLQVIERLSFPTSNLYNNYCL
jgi:hypothetical protein